MVAKIFLWNQWVGAVLWDADREIATLEFSTDFVKLGLDLAPIAMPLEKLQLGQRIYSFPRLNNQTFLGLPGLLADALPDRFGNAIIDAWLAKKGRDPNSVNPVEKLCFMGNRSMGALEFTPAVEFAENKDEVFAIDEMITVAKEILQQKRQLHSNLHEDGKDAMRSILKVGTSAGGARAKAVIALNAETGEIRSGNAEVEQGFEHWIIKFDGMGDLEFGNPMGYGRIEYAHYLMAKDCGIEMAECRLLEENDRAHFMTRRFDRIGNEKIHQQSLCGMAHFDYNLPGIYSYEQAFQVMRTLRLPYHDAEQMYMRMVFNVMARNQDDHTKNIGFLMTPSGKWRLSPAYDMSYAYNPEGGWTSRHQMTVNGKAENITKNDLLNVAREMNIKKPESLIQRIHKTIKNWPTYAEISGVSESNLVEISRNQQIL